MLQFGVRGHDIPGETLEERVKNIAEAGFCCTQLALSKAVREFPTGAEAMTSGMAMYMRRLFEQYRVNVAVLGCYKNLATPDEEELKQNLKLYMHHIRFASYLGCGVVGTETGAVNREYRYTPENHTKEALRIFTENLKKVVAYAETMGVCVGIEPVYKHIMCDLERTREVLRAVNSPNLRVILDPINLLNAENESRHNEIVDGAFELFGEEIDIIHMKDYVVRDGEIISRPVTLGEGRFDIPHLLKLIKQKKPFINISLEDSIPENVQQSRAYVMKCYEEA